MAEMSGWGPLVSPGDKLHHLGLVVPSISGMAEEFAQAMGLWWDRKTFDDLRQRVKVAFFFPEDARNPVYELVEPADDTSPVNYCLRKGGGLHHVCYETDDLEAGLDRARTAGFGIVAPPTPAVAFDGRNIAWVCSRNRLLIELLERERRTTAEGSGNRYQPVAVEIGK